MRISSLSRSLLFAVAMACASAHGAESVQKCIDIEDDRSRLGCYDQAAGRPPSPPKPEVSESAKVPDGVPTKAAVAGDFVGGESKSSVGASRLSLKWELDDDTRYGVYRFRTHKPNYVLPFRYSRDPNETPSSRSLGPIPAGTQATDRAEFKIQLSFKTKFAQGLLNDKLDLWFGYTQQSNWQLYAESAPFRETNYEPEVMALVHTNYNVMGLRMRFVNFGFVHQSNGRDGLYSRSWNRLYAQLAFERGDFALLVRPWWRIPESSERDNNPDITTFVGRGDALLTYTPDNGQSLALLVRNNFRTDPNRGAWQIDWRFPLYRNLKGYLQLFTGYGETLIDYNYKQTVFGLGISLSDWM